MPNGYTQSPKLLKGALIELTEPFLGPVPNVIVFQYNPEKLTRTLTPWSATDNTDASSKTSTAQPFDPGETFDLDLELDATDALEEPEKHPIAVLSGVADRIAALEMLLYPTGDSLLGDQFATLGGLINRPSKSEALPRGTVPIVLIVFGPGLIAPVRLTSFSVEVQAFSPTLYPIQATVKVGLKILTADSFKACNKELSASEKLAVAAYNFTRGQKETLARANLANSVESILAMLPF